MLFLQIRFSALLPAICAHACRCAVHKDNVQRINAFLVNSISVKRLRLIFKIFRCFRSRRLPGTISGGQDEEEEKKRAYLALMRKLVTMKLQSES